MMPRMLLGLFLFLSLNRASTVESAQSGERLTLSMDNLKPKPNDYYCTSLKLEGSEQYVVGFHPEADVTMVHHLLLFGCEEPYSEPGAPWDCKGMGGTCATGKETILFAWARNASGLELPKDVGFKVGREAGVNYLVLQLHYGDMPAHEPGKDTDSSGISLTVIEEKQPKVGGIYVLVGDGPLQSSREGGMTIEGGCDFNSEKTITPFAYRVHAHHHSDLISGFYRKGSSGKWSLLGSRSPQDPQAFYTSFTSPTVSRGDLLATRCTYHSDHAGEKVHTGSETTDEMCNFYIMYYTDNDGRDIDIHQCSIISTNSAIHPPLLSAVSTMPPPTHSTPPPPPPTAPPPPITESPPPTPTIPPTSGPQMLELAGDWVLNGLEGAGATPFLSLGLGQVSGVAVDGSGGVWILHRGSRVWDASSFSFDNEFRHKEDGPIKEPTLLHLSSTGQIVHKWGENMFYMPHGLTVDPSGNIWITDVAMHQVFKFSPDNLVEPKLTLGTAFEPGSDTSHFCKPTAVAVDSKGYFYIADGYCNRRVIKYSSSGGLLQVMDKAVDGRDMNIPHSLALINNDTQLMVADRENGRIITMETSDLSRSVTVMRTMAFRDAVFAVAAPNLFNPVQYLYAINYDRSTNRGEGLTVTLPGMNINQTWLPTLQGKKIHFGMAHDIATSGDGREVYVAEVSPNRIWKFVQQHPENAEVHVSRNRTIGLVEPSALAGGDGSKDSANVDVQDETNMPDDHWNEGLHSDTNVTTKPPTENEEEEYKCPSSVPPEECTTSVVPSPVTTPNTAVAQAVPTPDGPTTDQTPPTTDQTPPTDANGPLRIAGCVSATQCFAFSVRSHLSLIVAGVVLLVLALLSALIVLVVVWFQCRRRCPCRVRKGLSQKAQQAKENLHSLIGPSHKGFVKVRTFDSDSEAEDIVFQRI